MLTADSVTVARSRYSSAAGSGGWRIECLDRGQRTGKALDLDKGNLAGAALRQPRGADIPRQNVRVAVHAEWRRCGRIFGIVPGAGRELYDTGAQRFAQHCAGEAGAAIAVNAHDVAVVNAAIRRVAWMDAHRLASLHFRREA